MPPIIDIQHLTKSYGDKLLLSDVCLSIAERERVGLIARNGTGKSTLLRILSGQETADEGLVVLQGGTRIAYLEQTPKYAPEESVIDVCFRRVGELSALISRYERCLATPGTPGIETLVDEMERREAWQFEQRAKQVLTKLCITDYDKPISLLSGGQQKRVALAGVLLAEADLLILDEPTNHLDIEMTEWLENYLKRLGKSILLVTHDRYFLENVCSVIHEIDDTHIYTYRGNYSYYLQKHDERIRAEAAEAAKAANLYRKELEWMRRMPQARATKARYRKEAFAELEQRARVRREERAASLDVKSSYIGTKIFEAEYVSKSFPRENAAPIVLLHNFCYTFSRYEKMGIVGPNGTGKSTFVRMLLGIVRPDSGRFVVGQTIRFGYFSQEPPPFSGDKKVIDAVRDVAEVITLSHGRKLTAMQLLTRFLFPPSRQQDYIRKLSGGELRRLHLCTVLMQNPNFLILDEPTNDLDIATLAILEEYLIDFNGCVIVVSHDRYFTDRVVDHLLVFRGDGRVDDFPGNYSQYREWSRLEEENAKERNTLARNSSHKNVAKPATHSQNESSPATEKSGKLSFKERKEMEMLETEIAVLESERAELEQALCSGTLTSEELTEKSIRLPKVTTELDEKSTRWLLLAERA